MNITTKKVVVQPAVEEVSKDVVVLEMSKCEAAALFVLWHSSAWFPVSLHGLKSVLGERPCTINGDAFDEDMYSDYHETLTDEARRWVESFE